MTVNIEGFRTSSGILNQGDDILVRRLGSQFTLHQDRTRFSLIARIAAISVATQHRWGSPAGRALTLEKSLG